MYRYQVKYMICNLTQVFWYSWCKALCGCHVVSTRLPVTNIRQ